MPNLPDYKSECIYMKNFAAIDVIKSFSPEEVKKFDKFVRSPYFGSSDYIVNFWRELKKFYPDFSKEKFSKEKIFKKTYPGKKYNDSLLRKLFSELFKMCESFLLMEMVHSNSPIAGWLLLNQYSNRGLNTQFENKFKKVNDELESVSDFDYWVLLRRHNIYTQKVNNMIARNMGHITFAEKMVTLETIIAYTLILALEEIPRRLHRKEIYKSDSEFNVADVFLSCFNIKEFVEKLKTNASRYADIIELHKNLAEISEGQNKVEEFNRVQQYLFDNNSKMSPKSAFMYFTFMMNYCQTHSNTGIKTFDRNVIQILDFMDKKDLLLNLNNKYITPQMFRGVFISYIDAHEFEKAESFLLRYKNNLEENTRNDVVNLSYADFHFAKKDFEKAIDLLANVEPVVFLDKINIRLVRLISFYELGNSEICYSLIDSIRNYIRMNKVFANEFGATFEVFIKLYKMLCDCKFLTKISKEDIIIEYNKAPDFLDKDWIKEKINEFK